MNFTGRDVKSIQEHFAELEDPRSHINQRHILGDLVVICIMAVLANADGPSAIAEWAKARKEWLKNYLTLPNGVPSRDTIRRLLQLLKPEAFQHCFQSWIIELQTARGVEGREIIAIDGKDLRRSHDKRNNLGTLFLVQAWAAEAGLTLGQVATEEESNETTAIPRLLETIDVSGAIVTIDAAGCQRKIAEQIKAGGGDFVLSLKGNQKKLHQDVVDYILKHQENDFADVTMRRHREIVKGHGRVDDVTYYQLKVPESIAKRHNWPGGRTIGVAIRFSEGNGKETDDVRYYLSSLPLGVKQFARAIRRHWTIENSLHWCLDVTFREDESRVRERHVAENLAWLKRFAISLLKQENDKRSIAMRRRVAAWNPQYLAKLLGI